jgi:hypothetical protein
MEGFRGGQVEGIARESGSVKLRKWQERSRGRWVGEEERFGGWSNRKYK